MIAPHVGGGEHQNTAEPRLLLTHAAQLLTLAGPDRARRGREMRELGIINDGAVLIENGRIAAAGIADEVTRRLSTAVEEVDCSGLLVTPGLVDSHTHLLFAAPRLDDFERRLNGASYEEIVKSGGGIQSSVERLRASSDEALLDHALHWMARARAAGTTTLEVKTGYGLTAEQELRMLRLSAAASSKARMRVVLTLLGAHALPNEYADRRQAYVTTVVDEMIPAAANAQPPAEFADAFCERGMFTLDETERILAAAGRAGLKLKLHAEQLSHFGAIQLGVRLGAVSVDHLDFADDNDIRALVRAETIATLLPGPSLFLGTPFPDARRFIDAGAAVSLATDFNPGTSPVISMALAMSLACTEMHMTPAEAWTAATINAAAAVARSGELGSLVPGKAADLALWHARDYREVPYYVGTNLCAGVVQAGELGWVAAV